jgi:hypothetical protein
VGEDPDTDYSDYGLLLGDAAAHPLRAPVRPRAGFVLKIAVVAGLLVALVLILAGVPQLVGDDGTAGPVRNLGKVSLEPVPGDLPRVVAEIGQSSRVQAVVLREVGPRVYRPALTRRLGVVEAGTVTLELGSGHASDGAAPGQVLDTSRMIPFTVVPGQGGGLTPGRYTVTVQMRSVD